MNNARVKLRISELLFAWEQKRAAESSYPPFEKLINSFIIDLKELKMLVDGGGRSGG